MPQPDGKHDRDGLLEGYLDFAAELLQERSRWREREQQNVLLFIEVMDSFDRFLVLAGEDAALPHLRSVALIAKQLQEGLRKAGAIPMDCRNRIAEPDRHTVVDCREDGSVEEDTILDVIARGYLDGEGDTLRKARVVVARPPQQAHEKGA